MFLLITYIQEEIKLLYLRGLATASWAHNGIHSSFNLPTIKRKQTFFSLVLKITMYVL